MKAKDVLISAGVLLVVLLLKDIISDKIKNKSKTQIIVYKTRREKHG